MMTQCPKCNATDIMAPLRPVTSADVHPFVRITEPDTGVFQIRARESAELQVAVCGACGYLEQYVDEAPRLWKYWQKGYR